MMRIFLPLLLFASVLCSCQPTPASQEPENESVEQDDPAHPGWYAQWLAMKADDQGRIPEGIWRQLVKEVQLSDAQNKTAGTILTNVTEIGPDNIGGRTRALIQDILNPNRWLAGGISGGIWESTDNADTWHAVDDAAPQLTVTSLAQDPNLPLNVYYSTGEPRGNSAGVLGAGIWKSTDGGQTFAMLPATDNNNFNENWKVAVDPSTPNLIYVATHDDGLFRSDDGGATFSPVLIVGSTTDVTDVEVLPDGGVLVGIRTVGIYYSPTGLAGSYTQFNNGLPSGSFRRVEIAYCDSVPTTIYAQFEDNNGSDVLDIYKTTDGGNSWATVTNPTSSAGINYSFPWYAFLLSVKPDNPNILVSGSARMGYSLDGGNSWTSGYNSHADYHVAVWDRTNLARLNIGNDGGIHAYTTISLGSFATDKNTDYRVTQFYTGAFFPFSSDLMGGTQDNGTLCSRNYQSSFDRISGGDGAFCAVSQQNPSLSYVSYQNGIIRNASNSLAQFPSYSTCTNQLDGDGNGSIDDGAWFINPFEINMQDGNQVYFQTQRRLWRTTDGASNWEPVTNNINTTTDNPYIPGVSSDENPTIYIGGEKGMFYRVDNAKTATPGSEVNLSGSLPPSVTNDFISSVSVNPKNSSKVYVAFSTINANPRVWKVTNGNTSSPTWTSISGDLPTSLSVNWITSHPFSPDSILLAGTDFGLYVTTNGGNHWERETNIPAVVVTQIRIRETDQKAFIFTHGRGAFTADLPVITQTSTPKPEFSVQVYPNPASDFVWIRCEKAFEYRLLSLNGQEIQRGKGEKDRSCKVQLSGLSKGMYFVEIMTESGKATQKMLVK